MWQLARMTEELYSNTRLSKYWTLQMARNVLYRCDFRLRLSNCNGREKNYFVVASERKGGGGRKQSFTNLTAEQKFPCHVEGSDVYGDQ